jgi:glutamate 5-kinase
METKLIAAEIATGAGITTIITSSKRPENISSIIEYHGRTLVKSPGSERPSRQSSPSPDPSVGGSHNTIRPPHTVFLASATPMRDLKSWTSHTLYPSGSVIVDTGAYHVLSRRESGGRLLAAGVSGVIGAFASGQAVRIVVKKHKEDLEEVEAAREAYAQKSGTRPSTPGTPKEALLSRNHSSFSLAGVGIEDDVILVEKETECNVLEVGRGLSNYNSEQILKVKGLNR